VEPALHPDVVALACLLGTWSGEGEGRYPTIESFTYREEITFGHVGKPFLFYRQSTVRIDTGVPSHAEVGYLRGIGSGRVELVLAHPTGIAELSGGEITTVPDGLTLRLHSTDIVRTATAKDVRSVERSITVQGHDLTYDLSMAAVTQPHQLHLTATLHRVP
jgi:hypothetical protein